jgi:predicted  nucleic acid-binding Zn-ribbon protein
MNLNRRLPRGAIAGLLAVAALAVASGCGSSNSDKIKDARQQATQFRESATDAKTQLEAIQHKIESGELSAEEGQAEIEKVTKRLDAQARSTADKALDTASDLDGVPDEVKDQIDQARTELQQQP